MLLVLCRNYVLCFLYCVLRLDLDKWINDPPSESSEEEEEMDTIFDTPNEHKYDHTTCCDAC